ncbi:MAG: ribonuclease domain-containing protein [Tissierellia bacterium]|nr:ribonuclease domain-containing protein [Tissierellia bacterium]
MRRLKKFIFIYFMLFVSILTSCVPNNNAEDISSNVLSTQLEEDGYYYSVDDVSKYLSIYNKLPQNYLTKKEAKELGWIPSEGNLWDVTDKGVIGGDRFYNREEKLPDDKYYEADVDYKGGPRNASRLIFNYKGDIYYTKDHYESFERLY